MHGVGHAVVLGQALGEVGVVGGEKLEQAAVFVEHALEEQDRLLAHVGGDLRGVEVLDLVERGSDASTDVLGAEPLAHEGMREEARTGMVE